MYTKQQSVCNICCDSQNKVSIMHMHMWHNSKDDCYRKIVDNIEVPGVMRFLHDKGKIWKEIHHTESIRHHKIHSIVNGELDGNRVVWAQNVCGSVCVVRHLTHTDDVKHWPDWGKLFVAASRLRTGISLAQQCYPRQGQSIWQWLDF